MSYAPVRLAREGRGWIPQFAQKLRKQLPPLYHLIRIDTRTHEWLDDDDFDLMMHRVQWMLTSANGPLLYDFDSDVQFWLPWEWWPDSDISCEGEAGPITLPLFISEQIRSQ